MYWGWCQDNQTKAKVKCFLHLYFSSVLCHHKLNKLKTCSFYSNFIVSFGWKARICSNLRHRDLFSALLWKLWASGRARPITQHVTSNIWDLTQFSTLLIFYLMAVCSYYFCLPLLFCGENPAVKIQVNSFYFSTSCCCSICQSCCRKQKIVAEQPKKNALLYLMWYWQNFTAPCLRQ